MKKEENRIRRRIKNMTPEEKKEEKRDHGGKLAKKKEAYEKGNGWKKIQFPNGTPSRVWLSPLWDEGWRKKS